MVLGMLSDFLNEYSGLAVVSIPIYPEAYSVIPEFSGLVEYIIRSQVVNFPVQSDIQRNPFILTEVSSGMDLRILCNNSPEDTKCFGVVSDLRLHVQDLGGQYLHVGTPKIYFNRFHQEIISRGFSFSQYHTWAVRNCPGYNSPPEKVLASFYV